MEAFLVLGGAGLALGLLVNRWWALIAAPGVGVWAGNASELEVPGWYIGLVLGGFVAVGILAGIGLRRGLRRLHS